MNERVKPIEPIDDYEPMFQSAGSPSEALAAPMRRTQPRVEPRMQPANDNARVTPTVEPERTSRTRLASFSEDVLDGVVSKPWGHEYRLYADAQFEAWKLTIQPGLGTSTHYHVKKDTALLCLRGRAKVNLLSRSILLGPGDHVPIGVRAFHATENPGQEVLELIEVEAPRNKLDLVRVQDAYGRVGRPYERSLLDLAIPPLVSCDAFPGAVIRSGPCVSGYRVRVGSLHEAPARRGKGVRFAVDLGCRGARWSGIRVLGPHERGSAEAGPYLIIESVQEGGL